MPAQYFTHKPLNNGRLGLVSLNKMFFTLSPTIKPNIKEAENFLYSLYTMTQFTASFHQTSKQFCRASFLVCMTNLWTRLIKFPKNKTLCTSHLYLDEWIHVMWQNNYQLMFNISEKCLSKSLSSANKPWHCLHGLKTRKYFERKI